MALKYPERLTYLILAAPAIYLYSPIPGCAIPYLNKKALRLFGQALIHPTRRFTRRILKNVWHDPRLITDEIVSGYEKPFHAIHWEAGLWEFSMAPHVKNIWKRREELKMPVLVIAGDDDRVVPTRHSRRLAEITPGAKFVLISGCGHIPNEEKPEIFIKELERILKRN